MIEFTYNNKLNLPIIIKTCHYFMYIRIYFEKKTTFTGVVWHLNSPLHLSENWGMSLVTLEKYIILATIHKWWKSDKKKMGIFEQGINTCVKYMELQSKFFFIGQLPIRSSNLLSRVVVRSYMRTRETNNAAEEIGISELPIFAQTIVNYWLCCRV